MSNRPQDQFDAGLPIRECRVCHEMFTPDKFFRKANRTVPRHFRSCNDCAEDQVARRKNLVASQSASTHPVPVTAVPQVIRNQTVVSAPGAALGKIMPRLEQTPEDDITPRESTAEDQRNVIASPRLILAHTGRQEQGPHPFKQCADYPKPCTCSRIHQQLVRAANYAHRSSALRMPPSTPWPHCR
jgi:hypothetical protein